MRKQQTKKNSRRGAPLKPSAHCMADPVGKWYVVYQGNLIARDLTEERSRSLAGFITKLGYNKGLKQYAERWNDPKPA